MNLNTKPFIKWAGGKSQLLGQFDTILPKTMPSTYVEPFIGGGAMFFRVASTHTEVNRFILNDINGRLVKTYCEVRDNVDELIESLRELQEKFIQLDDAKRKEMFADVKKKFNSGHISNLETASYFIFLNKTGFNGMYRENSKGEYNIPIGKYKNPTICDKETLENDSIILKGVEILNGSYDKVMESIKEKAFIYMDPPYRPLSTSSSFNTYSKDGFSDDDQARLAEFCKTVDGNGHMFMLSNSDPHNTDPNDDFFDDLYSDFTIKRVNASRTISSKASGRKPVSEIVVTNF